MPLAPDIKNLLLGRGAIYFDRFSAAGALTGERHLGNCNVFQTSMEDDRIEVQNFLTQAGGTYREISRDRAINLSISMYELNPDNLALLVMGETGTLTQSNDTVTDEQVGPSTPSYGVWYKLENRQVSSVVVEQGAQTLEVDTDYEVDARTGRIRLIEGGPNVDLVTTTADYTAAEITGLPKVSIGSKSVLEGFMRFIGDPAAGGLFEVELWKVSLQPDGVMDLIGEDVANPSITGLVLDDSTNHAEPDQFGRIIELQGTYR